MPLDTASKLAYIKEEKLSLRAKIKAINVAAAEECAPASLEGTAAASLVGNAAAVLAFASMQGESDTAPIIDLALKGGKTLLLPRISGKSLDFVAFGGSKNELRPNRFGTLEPIAGKCLFSACGNEDAPLPFPALIVVPGLAFDRKGGRLGRGSGFYDRFLHELSARYPRPRYSYLVAGFCFNHQIVEAVPVEPTDFAMDCLILPDGSIIGAEGAS